MLLLVILSYSDPIFRIQLIRWFDVVPGYYPTNLGSKCATEELGFMISFLPYLDLFWFHVSFLCIGRRSWHLEMSHSTVLRLKSNLPDGDGDGGDGHGEEFPWRWGQR